MKDEIIDQFGATKDKNLYETNLTKDSNHQ